MNKLGKTTDLCLSGLGSLGNIFSTSMAMGCCAGLLGPIASIGAIALPFLGPSLQMPLLYTAVTLTLTGLVLSYRRQHSAFYLISGLLGALLLLIPFHTALDVRLFYLLVGLGLGSLLLASWGPLIWVFSSLEEVEVKQVKVKPVAGSVSAGLIASICCGGSLIFASIGLGAFYGALGLWRYVPQVLAVGALSIVAINYFFYWRAAGRIYYIGRGQIFEVRRAMFVSAAVGLAAMAGSFVFLEWFNHAVVNPHRFLSRPEYGQALVPGVPNIRLVYALASFFALSLLWALPFPMISQGSARGTLRWGLRLVAFSATGLIALALVVNAVRYGGSGGHGRPHHVDQTEPKTAHSSTHGSRH